MRLSIESVCEALMTRVIGAHIELAYTDGKDVITPEVNSRVDLR